MDKSIPDAAVSMLKHIAPVPKQSTKTSKANLEDKKAKLWEALADRLVASSPSEGNWQQAWQQGFQAGFQQAWQQCSQMFMQQQAPLTMPISTQPTTPQHQAFTPQHHQPFTHQPHQPFTPQAHQPFTPQHNRPFSTQPNLVSTPQQKRSPSARSPTRDQPLRPHKRRGRFNVDLCIDCGQATKYCVYCNVCICNACSTPVDPDLHENYCEEGERKNSSM